MILKPIIITCWNNLKEVVGTRFWQRAQQQKNPLVKKDERWKEWKKHDESKWAMKAQERGKKTKRANMAEIAVSRPMGTTKSKSKVNGLWKPKERGKKIQLANVVGIAASRPIGTTKGKGKVKGSWKPKKRGKKNQWANVVGLVISKPIGTIEGKR